jgi:gliding motility-associated-like protein
MGLSSQAQVYLLNEDFSSASTTRPPSGWNSITFTGGGEDVWRFDNPAKRVPAFPITGTFAIFDSENYSGGNGAEKVSLETPFIDCSFSPFTILYFDHQFSSVRNGRGELEVFDGSVWSTVKTYVNSTVGAVTESIDISALTGSKASIKLRFTWNGDSSEYWMIDNVKLYAPLLRDGRVKSITNPVTPVNAGINPVRISLANEGYQPITSAIFGWSINGVRQPNYSWTGNIVRDQELKDIEVGNYDFPIGTRTAMRFWLVDVNGTQDLNKLNDTLDVELYTPLCGVFTIGGANPNFSSFSDAARVLNNGGVGCPVVFKVRDGVYNEQLRLLSIPGVSSLNNVLFESESGDSSKAILFYQVSNPSNDYTVRMTGTSNVAFKKLSIQRGSGSVSILSDEGVNNITFESAILLEDIVFRKNRNIVLRKNTLTANRDFWSTQFENSNNILLEDNIYNTRYCIRVIGSSSDSITIRRNSLRGESIGMSLVGNVINSLIVEENTLSQFSEYGIFVSSLGGSDTRINYNRLSRVNGAGIIVEGVGAKVIGNRILETPGGSGIIINGTNTVVANNFVQVSGLGVSKGISLNTNSNNNRIQFNSVNVLGVDQVNGIAFEVLGGLTHDIRNNIFANHGGGISALYKKDISNYTIESNNYYSRLGQRVFYLDTLYSSINLFSLKTGKDLNSVDINPYFISDTNLIPTHVLLNNRGVFVADILNDIDKVSRAGNPDIGAKEFDLCLNDAGIDWFFGIGRAVQQALLPVQIVLRNHGTAVLSSTNITWSVNGVNQPVFNWSGSLSSGQSEIVTIGNYLFTGAKTFTLSAATEDANGVEDCKTFNNRVNPIIVATSLCGTYTIGGQNPDFTSISEAVFTLNTAGINCPVIFKIRNGTYLEQVTLSAIPGASAINTITFESESGDSTKVIVQNNLSNPSNDFVVRFNGTRYVTLRKMSISRNSGSFSVMSDNSAGDIVLENNILNGILIQNTNRIQLIRNNIRTGFRLHGIQIVGSRFLYIDKNTYECHYGIQLRGAASDSLFIRQNIFNSSFANEGGAISIEVPIEKYVAIDSNYFSNFKFYGIGSNISNGGKAFIRSNVFKKINGTVIGLSGAGGDVLGNRITGIEVGTGINVNAQSSLIANNFIQARGIGVSEGIVLQPNASNSRIYFNSINILGTDFINGKALKVIGGINYNIKNNIFSNLGGGNAASYGSDVATYDLSHNNYYSSGFRNIEFNGKTYDAVSTFAFDVNKDRFSLSANPYFISDSSAEATNSLLENSGLPIQDLAVDINWNPRNSNPDMGAQEFDLCSFDAGIFGFWERKSSVSSGLQPIRVILQNHSNEVLNTVKIGWSVNGVVQAPFTWSGTIEPKGIIAVNIGEYFFKAGATFAMKSWTESPNSTFDCRIANDSCYTLNVASQLCGTYTIGGQNPDYTSLSQAAFALNAAGVGCPVTFKIRDGIYDDQLRLLSIPGSSFANNILFESESQDSSKVILRYQQGNPSNDFTVMLNGASYVSFKKLTIQRSAGSFSIVSDGQASNIALENNSMGIMLLRNSQNISVKNNLLRTDFRVWGVQLINVRNLNYEKNVNQGHYGIRIFAAMSDSIIISKNTFINLFGQDGEGGGVTSEAAVKSFLVVDSNTFKNYNLFGVSINSPANSMSYIRGNRFENLRNNGIIMDGIGGVLNGNRILGMNVGTGITLNAQKAIVANNFIQTSGIGISRGINIMSNATGSQIIYNSVNILGTDIINGRALEISGGTNYVIKNNIFANNGGGYAAYVSTLPAIKDVDYNNYYSKGTNFGYLNGALINDLGTWSRTFIADINSKNINPNFKSDTALLPFQKQFNGAGVATAGILLDIDGEIRNLQAPDIGAQEFMVDFGVNRLVNPTNECKQSATTPITVFLRQFGDIPFIDLKLAYQVNNGPIFRDTIPGSISNDLEFTFKQTQDLSLTGSYVFKIWLVENGDDNLNNDTLTVTRQNKDLPVVDFTADSQCAGTAVSFVGTASITSGFIDRLEWDFGDSTIGVGYTPKHIYDTSGKYSVTLRAYSDQGCYGEIKKPIDLIATPIASFDVKDVCFGVPVSPLNLTTVKNGISTVSYQWKWGDGNFSDLFQPTHLYGSIDTFNISLIAKADNGCIDSTTKPVVIFGFKSAAYKLTIPTQTFICEGTPLKLSAVGAIKYQWFLNGNTIPGAIDSIYDATLPGAYSVGFFNQTGCSTVGTDTLKLSLIKEPKANFSNEIFCSGIPIKFINKSIVDSQSVATYSWNFGDESSPSSTFNPLHSYKIGGIYPLKLIVSSNNCINHKDTITRELVIEDPVPPTRYSPVSGVLNSQKELFAREIGIKYEWIPATDLSNPSIFNPIATILKEQEYIVKITNVAGCITADTVKVLIFDNYDIFVPKAFTPNGDGINDRLYPFKVGIKIMQVFRIYDRLGNLVYDNRNAGSADGWDGTFMGRKLPYGVFVWVAEGIADNGQIIRRTGSTALIR